MNSLDTAAGRCISNMQARPVRSYYGPKGADPNAAAAAAYAKDLVGPTTKQMADVASQISDIAADLSGLGKGTSITTGIALGAAAGDAMIASRANDGSKAANVQTLTPFVPANEGQPGVYVPPNGRPAMTPTWGTVAPVGMSKTKLGALEAAGARAAAPHFGGLCTPGAPG